METKIITVRGKEYNVNPSKVKELCDTTNPKMRIGKEPAAFNRLYNHSIILKTGVDIDYDSITDETLDQFVRQFE